MSREITVIRHGKALPAAREDGPYGPSLTPDSVATIKKMQGKSPVKGFLNADVATSASFRAQETGLLLGAAGLLIYRSLNEIDPDMPAAELKDVLAEGEAPDQLLEAGDFTLANPPAEDYWVVHGWRWAGIVAADAYRRHRDIKGVDLLLPNLEVATLTL